MTYIHKCKTCDAELILASPKLGGSMEAMQRGRYAATALAVCPNGHGMLVEVTESEAKAMKAKEEYRPTIKKKELTQRFPGFG